MKNLFQITFLLFSSLLFSQTKAEKIQDIFDLKSQVKLYRSEIDRLKNDLKDWSEQDRLQILEIDQRFSEEKLMASISKMYEDYFSDKEVDEIYTFIHSSTGQKMFNLFPVLEKTQKIYFDIKSEIQPFMDKKIMRERQNNDEKPKPISVDKESGFYKVLNENTTAALKEIKLSENPAITVDEIKHISIKRDDLDRIVVDIELTKSGAEKFKKLTENNIGKPLAIVLNHHLVSSPRINETIANGRIQISGNFSEEEVIEMIYWFNQSKK